MANAPAWTGAQATHVGCSRREKKRWMFAERIGLLQRRPVLHQKEGEKNRKVAKAWKTSAVIGLEKEKDKRRESA